MAGKQTTAIGTLLVLLMAGLLAVGIVALVKVYSTPAENEVQAAVTTTATTTTAAAAGTTAAPTSTTTIATTTAAAGGGGGGGGGGGNGLNIPTPPTVSETSNASEYPAYQQFVQALHASVNLSADPCNNFYEYACGNFSLPYSNFGSLTLRNYKLIADQFAKNSYISGIVKPVQQAADFYTKCYASTLLPAGRVIDPARVDGKIANLTAKLDNVPFPSMTPNATSSSYTLPNATTLASVLGYLSYSEHLDTLVTPLVDTNWKAPHSGKPYAFFIDQSTLSLPDTYYQKIWDQINGSYFNSTLAILQGYASYLNLTVDADQLRNDTQAILSFEYMIATQINTPDSIRRSFNRSYNPYTASAASAAFPQMDFSSYMWEGTHIQWPDSYEFYLMETGALAKLLAFIQSEAVDPRTVYNYLYFRLLLVNFPYLPDGNSFKVNDHLEALREISGEDPLNDGGHLGRKKMRQAKRTLPHHHPARTSKNGDIDDAMVGCVDMNVYLFGYANARAYIDARLPTADQRTTLRASVGQMIANVVDAFQGQLSQLDWMSGYTKQGAYSKVSNLVKNVAWPDWILDDGQLMNYYSNLTYDYTQTNFTAIQDALLAFQRDTQLQMLLWTNDTNRLNFLASPSTINAWYQPELNSITFPLAILGEPFYNPHFPTSVNFGGIGIVAGHELTHGFDDQGVQWDGTGVLHEWMDQTSRVGFDSMAQCVVDQYNSYYPLPNLHIDGTQTEGENIADNGGIRSSYRAYQAHISLYGPDPQLDDQLYKYFTQDQLFFLNFGQLWCAPPKSPAALQKQLLVDPHSPSRYRVLGSIQNDPAFAAAFHCPIDSVDAPSAHCNVWVSDSKQSTGIPPTTTTLPSINIPTNTLSSSENYAQVGKMLESSIDTSVDPCTDFYSYACGNKKGQISWDVADDTSAQQMVTGLMKPIVPDDPKPVQQVKQLFGTCQTTFNNWTNYISGGSQIKAKMDTFKNATNFLFPLFSDSRRTNWKWPNSSELGKAVGVLSGLLETDTLLTGYVYSDIKESQSNKVPYRLYIDQATVALPQHFYMGQTWDLFKDW